MRIEVDEACPYPDDPVLAELASVLQASDDWGWIVDPRWRLLFITDQVRLSMAGGTQLAALEVNEHLFGPAQARVLSEARFGFGTVEIWRAYFASIGGHVLADTPGGHDALRDLVDPALGDLVDALTPVRTLIAGYSVAMGGLNAIRDVHARVLRILDVDGSLRGTLILSKPAVPMTTLSVLAFQRDPEHLQRMFAMSSATRRSGAVLFADLESSSALARRLPTGRYFAVVRRLVRASDQCIVDAGGLVGRHVGDGVVAFFPVESFASESAAAKACISAARAIRTSLHDVAERSDLAGDDLVARFGLHWGANLFMGSIITSARSEVTALGDEANEAARIEACATGGRTLASKQLVERLDSVDAAALDIDLDHLEFRRMADLDSATAKARRDAPAVAVCEL